jgi:hypothetical protein
MGNDQVMNPDSKEKYSAEYRHFDTLIWQTPAWCTAIFLVTMIGLNSITEKNAAVVHTVLSSKALAIGFVSIMFLLLFMLTHVLYRFRIHQSSLKQHKTPFWASASTYMQTLVTAQAMSLLAILLLLCGFSLLWAIAIPAAILLGVSVYREIRVRKG